MTPWAKWPIDSVPKRSSEHICCTVSQCRLNNKAHLAFGTQRMYMQPILFPRLDRVRSTSIVSSSLWEYWNSARSVRWSFQRPSTLPDTEALLRTRVVETPWPGGGGPASGSERKVYVGSGGRKASFAAIRLGQGGQQKRQQTSLKESPFILRCAGRQKR